MGQKRKRFYPDNNLKELTNAFAYQGAGRCRRRFDAGCADGVRRQRQARQQQLRDTKKMGKLDKKQADAFLKELMKSGG
jgi:hypothetical protein